MKHTLSCLAYNKPGVLAKVASSFAQENINIYSLAAGEVEEEGKSRMTIVVDADNLTIERAEKRLKEIDDIIKVYDFQEGDFIAMELLIVKIKVRNEYIPQILQIAELFNAQVIAVSDVSMVLTLASEEKRINGLVKMLSPLGIIEMCRSGKLAVSAADGGEKKDEE
ncbi:MAG TPA: acetolactate synthase small subunit [Spirochaetes bacterium]|nr:acetolactate synthase small subunit [Spirochaetota bacterium]